MISLKVDTKNVEAKLKGFEAKAKDVIQKEMDTFALNTVADAQRLCPVDESHLKGSISYNSKPLKVEVVVASDYAAYVEFGTRKFAAAYVATLPPNWQAYAATFKGKTGGSMDDFVQRIMAWVQRKGIGALKTKSGAISSSVNSLDAMQQAAYAIALNILQNGIRPQPFLFPAVQKNLIALKKRLN